MIDEEGNEKPCDCLDCRLDREPTYTVLGPGWTIFGFKAPLDPEDARTLYLFNLGPDRIPNSVKDLKMQIAMAMHEMNLDRKKREKGE